ncbi:MAG: MFS transporter, partial [Steroidobacteraceae bacterium]
MPNPQAGATIVRWRILALIILACFVGYFLRSNMSVAGEAMMRDLSLSKAQLGFILAGFAWGYAAFQFAGGVLGERLGARRIITLCLLAWGVLNLLVGLVPSAGVLPVTAILVTLVVLRTLMGVAQAPLFPVVGGPMVCAWFPIGGWAVPSGLQNVGLTFGAAATPPVIAWLMQEFGWRASFVITAPLGLALAIVWRWYVRDTPQSHPGVNREELALIDANRP